MASLTDGVSTAYESSPALLFDERSSETAVTNVIVHPLVLFHVLDHHTRRQEDTGRVIGTLLGRRDGSTVEVTNCFSVPHAERGEEVAIGKDFNKRMLNLHLRSNRRETVVGWYASAATGEEGDENAPDLITDTSSLIHEFYSSETDEGDTVHLVVDTRLQTNSIGLRAYKSAPIVVQGESLGILFHEIRLSLHSNEPETICLNEMILQDQGQNGQDGTVDRDTAVELQVSIEKLYSLLDETLSYVDKVVDGKLSPDSEVGRKLADTLASVPRVRPEVFDRLFHDSLQDLLMVTYLSSITRTQLTIAEKLNASLGP